MMDSSVMSYDSRTAASPAPLHRSMVAAPQFMMSRSYSASGPMTSMAPSQYAPQLPMAFLPFGPHPPMNTYKQPQQYPERSASVAPFAPSEQTARSPVGAAPRPAPVPARKSPSPIKMEVKKSVVVFPAAPAAKKPDAASPRRRRSTTAALPVSPKLEQLVPGKTIIPIVSESVKQPNFSTAIDVLMKTIQANPETHDIVQRVQEEQGTTALPPMVSAEPKPEARLVEEKPVARALPKPGKKQPALGEPNKSRRYRCKFPGCTQSFFQNTHLTIHNRSHTGERPFFCTVPGCSARFSQRGNLKAHERRHTGEKPYACDECGKTFAQRGNVKAHKKTHLGMKPFPCKLAGCTKAFSQRGNLKMHQNKFHMADVAELNRKFASIMNLADVSEEDRELWMYFAAVYKNSNKGIKGRGHARRIGAVPRSSMLSRGPCPPPPYASQHSSPMALPPPQQGSHFQAPTPLMTTSAMLPPRGPRTYHMYDNDHDGSSASSVTSTIMYDDDHGRHDGLAFGDRNMY